MKLFVLCCLLSVNVWATIDPFTLNNEKTLYIVDGDSVSLSMRIKGIDTPEMGQTCQKVARKTQDCGKIAKAYIATLIKELPGKLKITPVGTGYYGRVLVHIFKGQVNIGQRMVAHGMAFARSKLYRQDQHQAKADKLGFWNFHTAPIAPYQWRKLNKR